MAAVSVKRSIRINLINPTPKGFKTLCLHVKMLDCALFMVRSWKNETCFAHLLSKNMQWNYASFNVTLNYLMYWIMEFCMASSLALDNLRQKYCQTLGKLISQTIHTTCYCCKDDYFTKRKFKNLIDCFTQCTLFFQKDCFLLRICLPCVFWGSYARDHGMLRDIFFCARQLRAKILSYSWQ